MSDSNTDDEFIDDLSSKTDKLMPTISYFVNDNLSFELTADKISITACGSTQIFNHSQEVSRRHFTFECNNKTNIYTVGLKNVVLQGSGYPTIRLNLNFGRGDELKYDLIHQIRTDAGYHFPIEGENEQ